jgi:hypothetical protein
MVRLTAMVGGHAIEAGSTRAGRWLRARRLRFTLWIAAIESLLYLFHALHWWAAVLLAVVGLVFYWYVGRSHRSDVVGEASWIFAASQLLVVVVPVVWAIAKTVAIAVFAILAIAALIMLFTERR